jgi:hypothetical protein
VKVSDYHNRENQRLMQPTSQSGQTGGPVSDRLLDEAGELAGTAKARVTEATAAIRGKTGNLQARLADFLESSAEVVRRRAGEAKSLTTGTTDVDETTTGRALSTVAERLAPQVAERGEAAAALLEQSAMWLRENDLSDIEARVTAQLEAHPVRTLAIAAAVGFLVSRRGD